MCEHMGSSSGPGSKTIPLSQAIGLVLAHDITEIRKDTFKGRAFKKGHIVRREDIEHLRRLGKEHLFVLSLSEDEVHEDEAAHALARALMGEGVRMSGGPKEGRINIVAARDGLVRIHKEALLQFNLLGEVMCATVHNHTLVREGQTVAGTRAIPLVVKKRTVEEAVRIATRGRRIIEVQPIRKPRAGIVITGNEVYTGKIEDAFAPLLTEKIRAFGGDVVGIHYAPDDEHFIAQRLRDLLAAGADLLITTGGMSVDPDDVTRFAVRAMGATELTYGSAMLPGAMFLVAYLNRPKHNGGNGGSVGTPEVPILGIPACGMYARITIFDIILPRMLAGERIGREALAELGHGGLCMKCPECRYPLCPFGK